MRIVIDTDRKTLTVVGEETRSLDLYGKEALGVLSALRLKTGWNQKYSYTFTWLGRPVIQHPEDVIRLQEVIYTVRPSVIVETGVAHGGSLVLGACLLKAMGIGGIVTGVDIEIRPHNRKALETHELAPMIALVEGDSVAPATVAQVARRMQPGDTVMVLLDSNHSKAHVLAELGAYHHFVTPGSYIVATDGLMRDLHGVPRGRPEWHDDNPAAAVAEFAARHPEFASGTPPWRFNESDLDKPVTAWPGAWLRRKG